MRLFLLFFLLTISDFLIAQHHGTLKMDKVIVDSSLDSYLFYQPKYSKIHNETKIVIKNLTTGKIDSTRNISEDIEKFENANLHDSSLNLLDFDNCNSFLKKDTLVIQFQNSHSLQPSPIETDKIYVYIVGGYFFCKYLSIDSPLWISPYSLQLQTQRLVLRKLISEKGGRLMGFLTVQFVDQNPKTKDRLLTIEGPFDCIAN